MALSASQKSVLMECQVPEDYQHLISRWMQSSEDKKSNQDFLLILSDLLQTSEKHLEIKRRQLSRQLNSDKGLISPGDMPPQISAQEENIKLSWLKAVSLWQAIDKVIRNPQNFDVNLSPKHVRYALLTRNLPVVEMLAWARPDFFNIGETSVWHRQLAWAVGGVLGALLGLFGGFLGGIREGLKRSGLKKLLLPLTALSGCVIGWSSGGVIGAKVGYRTGSILLASKLGYLSSYLNPFHDPKGLKNSQTVDLFIEETLFNIAQTRHRVLQSADNNRISF